MSGSVSTEANAEPNLTPMLDMVFQLVTFFMLVINFKAASLDLSLKLPVLGSALPVPSHGTDVLVLNVDSYGKLNVYGKSQTDIHKYIQGEAQASLITARRVKNDPSLKLGSELDTTIVIRADKTTSFKLLNKVIRECQDAGFRNFAMKAMNKAG